MLARNKQPPRQPLLHRAQQISGCALCGLYESRVNKPLNYSANFD